MKVSKNFLNEFIDIKDIDYKKLADDLVTVGNEYDDYYKMINATGIKVGHVLECEMHPESKVLHVCKVDLGNETVQIICGAPNVAQDQKVIVATIGAVLPGNITIKKAKLAGMESCGMICSLSEIGIESKYLTEEDKEGIHVLNKEAIPGDDPLKYLGFDDEIIDFDFTSNRGDMLSYLGIAYEVGAKYNKEVKYPEIKVEEEKENIEDIYSLEVKTDKCSVYLGKMVRNVTIKESPDFIKARLIASGIRPINNVVDISNYVMLEYGTPLHFFDADRLGNKVIVRMALENEEVTTLDNIKRTLNEEDIVIANDKEAVALAGVMGGLDTEVEKNTKNIFIESAIFNPVNIRRTSKRILRSEASSRFEKGIDPNRSLMALNRAAYLLNKYAGGKVLSGHISYDKSNKEDKKIEITLEKINSVLGMNLTKEEVKDTLERLKFKVELGETITVYVPTRRLDVSIKEDIIEEVGRIYGYDKIKSVLPTLVTKTGSYTKKETLSKKVGARLRQLGLSEVRTYSLLNDKQAKMFINEEYKTVKMLNAISEEHTIMRNTLITSLLEVYNYNTKRNVKNINIYEIASTYYVEEDYVEETKIAGLISGEYLSSYFEGINVKVDFYVLKGIIENLLKYLGLNNRYKFEVKPLKDMHPGRSAAILVNNKIIGQMGEIHPNLGKEVYVFEISLDKIMNLKIKDIKAKEISKYPSVNKDVAFITDKTSEEIEKVIKHTGSRMLTDVKVFDVYDMGDKKSIAYSLTFNNPNKTLSDEEVTDIFNRIIEKVEKETNSILRDK